MRAGSGKAGEHRSPTTVALLGVFTLGIYAAYWLWLTAREADRFDEQADSPFAVARWAVPTAAVGTAGATAIFVYVAQRAMEAPSAAAQRELAESVLSVTVPYIAFGIAMFVGIIASIVALWRLWRFVERHEQALGADPLSPGLLLAALIVAYLLFFPLPLAGAFVLYRTQRGLNRVWRAADEGYEAAAPQPAGGSTGQDGPRDDG